jgi:protein involved in polysaccharide export with SLBB domain
MATTMLTAWLAFMPGNAHAEQDSAYRVQPGDLLNISVYQWPEHSGEIRVDIGGAISRPAVGRFTVAGLTLKEIESLLQKELSKRIDTNNSPVVVNVADYRPISVLGAVTTPGRHRYEVGMTVLDALALAGGPLFWNARGDNFDQILKQAQLQEQAGSTELEFYGALARRERLLGEQADRDKLEFSSALVTSLKANGLEEIMTRERDVFMSRRTNFKQQLESMAQQIQLRKEEDTLLKQQVEEIRSALSKVEEEYKRLQALFERGIIRRTDIVSVDKQLTDLRGDLRSTIVAIANSHMDVAKTEASLAELTYSRKEKIQVDLLDAERQIKTLEISRSTRASLPPSGVDASAVGSESQIFLILRKDSEGGLTSISAEGSTPIQPGDIIRVSTAKQN